MPKSRRAKNKNSKITLNKESKTPFKNVRKDIVTTELKLMAFRQSLKGTQVPNFKLVSNIRDYGWKPKTLKTLFGALKIRGFDADGQHKLLVTLANTKALRPDVFGSAVQAAMLGAENSDTPMPDEILIQAPDSTDSQDIELQLEHVLATFGDTGTPVHISGVSETAAEGDGQKFFRFQLESGDAPEKTSTPPIATLGRGAGGGTVTVSGGGSGSGKSGGKDGNAASVGGKRATRPFDKKGDEDDEEERRRRPLKKVSGHEQDDEADDQKSKKRRLEGQQKKRLPQREKIESGEEDEQDEDIPEDTDTKKRPPRRVLEEAQPAKRQGVKNNTGGAENTGRRASTRSLDIAKKAQNDPIKTLGQGLPTTSAAIREQAGAPVLMAQFGGGEGSNAGDAAILTLRKSRRLFSLDFGGTTHQQDRADDLRKRERKDAPDDSSESEFQSDDEHSGLGRDIAVNTHAHADHIGLQTLTTAGVFERFIVGESSPVSLVKLENREQITDNGEVLFSWISKNPESKKPKIRITGLAIVPDTSNLPKASETPKSSKARKKKVDNKDNEKSLGVLIKVETVNAEGESERSFTMLSLGDMTPKEARERVLKTWKDDGQEPVDVIKMAHHGSDKNIHATPKETVTAGHTELVVSGYTMKDTADLLKFLNDTQPKQVTFLFDTRDRAIKFLELESVKNLQKSKPDGVKIVVAKDFIMAVDKEGKKSLKATQWG